MSRTENKSVIFIDDINKRTTWVKKKKYRKTFLFGFIFKVDPQTGKPSPLTAAQVELNQNRPLPVS